MDTNKVKSITAHVDKDVELTLNVGNGKDITLQGRLYINEKSKYLPYYLCTSDTFQDGVNIASGIKVSFSENNIRSITPIENTSTINTLLADIRNGSVKVQWKRWSFSGGHTDGDFDEYELFKDGHLYGSIEVNMQNGISIWMNGQAVCLYVETEVFQDIVKLDLLKALKRDDEELAAKLTDASGEIKLPGGFEDITREDVLSGAFDPFE